MFKLPTWSYSVFVCFFKKYLYASLLCFSVLKYIIVSEVTQSYSTLCDPMDPARLLHPWDFPGKSSGVGCHREKKNACHCMEFKFFS